jgi:MFS transporter, putative metabolite:H+ symporter
MTSSSTLPRHSSREIAAALLHPAVVVGALGYFVDIYDLILFAVVRVASLKGLGFSGDQLVTQGTWLINVQMGGMLLGGLIWGLLGDRFGRIKVLFGSIILYSLANIANGMVQSLDSYAICRFLAGLGLAGELGGCITLVAEILPQALRGYGTVMISAIGILGAVAAGYIGAHYDWRFAYYTGGGLGIILLFLRLFVHESGLFQTMNQEARPAFASQLRLLLPPSRLGRYLCCILIGLPSWYFIGLVILFSPEFAKALGSTEPVTAPVSVAIGYSGLSLGSLLLGALSQYLRSRKKVLILSLLATLVLINVFFNLHQPTANLVYAVIFFSGIAVGYWAIFVTVAAEHFGTNMRATVATTVPNFSRGAVIPITTLFAALKPDYGALHSGLAVGWIVLLIAIAGWFGLRETFHDDLDYLEK